MCIPNGNRKLLALVDSVMKIPHLFWGDYFFVFDCLRYCVNLLLLIYCQSILILASFYSSLKKNSTKMKYLICTNLNVIMRPTYFFYYTLRVFNIYTSFFCFPHIIAFKEVSRQHVVKLQVTPFTVWVLSVCGKLHVVSDEITLSQRKLVR
jgi:hypothetical protein